MNANYFEQNLQPYQIRFENALKEALPNKCRLLTDLINESINSNVKEIQQRFVNLVEDIFSFNPNNIQFNRSDWKLKTITREANYPEFALILEFLQANGILFKLIRTLSDPNIRYDFPISCLPAPTRAAFEEGLIPNFYTNKISQNFSNSISLNAFEYYIFHFAFFITRQEPNKGQANSLDNSNDNSNVIYYNLLENYMEAFIPIPSLSNSDPNEIKNSLNEGHSLWKSLSSTTSNILSLASPRTDHFNGKSQMSPYKVANDNNKQSSPATASLSPLFHKSPLMNSKIFSLNKFQQNLNANLVSHDHDLLGTILYKCETLLNILTEMWLNHVNIQVSTPNFEDNRNVKSSPQIPHVNFHFTVEHMRVIRIFVKHLHYFTNSTRKKTSDLNNSSLPTQYNSGGIVTSETNDPLDDLRRNIWSSKYLIQKKLYQFLRIAFDRWPNDTSFRVPLETLLSYIQPWRYVSRNNIRKKSDEQNDSQSGTDISEWRRFISENIFFYTIIFRQVINRISKILDLNSTSSAFLLYRITKVFAQNHLCELIKETELHLLNGSDYAMNFRTPNNLLSPSLKHMSSGHVAASFKHALLEMEPYQLEYCPFFSPTFRDQIINLLLKIAKYLNSSEQSNQNIQKSTSGTPSSSFISSIVNFFTEPPYSNVSNTQMSESSKTKHYLESSVRNLSLIFEIQPQSIQTIMSSEKASPYQLDSTDSAFNDQNVYETVEGLPKLSEHGRNLILSGSLKRQPLPSFIEGNPDLQPVRTFEFEFLVKVALFLSLIINKKYGTFFVKHYEDRNLLGFFLQQILSSPVKYVSYAKSNNHLGTEIRVETLPPRVNLRPIASKAFLFYIMCAFIFCKLFNFPFFNLTFLSSIIICSYFCLKSAWLSLNIK